MFTNFYRLSILFFLAFLLKNSSSNANGIDKILDEPHQHAPSAPFVPWAFLAGINEERKIVLPNFTLREAVKIHSAFYHDLRFRKSLELFVDKIYNANTEGEGSKLRKSPLDYPKFMEQHFRSSFKGREELFEKFKDSIIRPIHNEIEKFCSDPTHREHGNWVCSESELKFGLNLRLMLTAWKSMLRKVRVLQWGKGLEGEQVERHREMIQRWWHSYRKFDEVITWPRDAEGKAAGNAKIRMSMSQYFYESKEWFDYIFERMEWLNIYMDFRESKSEEEFEIFGHLESKLKFDEQINVEFVKDDLPTESEANKLKNDVEPHKSKLKFAFYLLKKASATSAVDAFSEYLGKNIVWTLYNLYPTNLYHAGVWVHGIEIHYKCMFPAPVVYAPDSNVHGEFEFMRTVRKKIEGKMALVSEYKDKNSSNARAEKFLVEFEEDFETPLSPFEVQLAYDWLDSRGKFGEASETDFFKNCLEMPPVLLNAIATDYESVPTPNELKQPLPIKCARFGQKKWKAFNKLFQGIAGSKRKNDKSEK